MPLATVDTVEPKTHKDNLAAVRPKSFFIRDTEADTMDDAEEHKEDTKPQEDFQEDQEDQQHKKNKQHTVTMKTTGRGTTNFLKDKNSQQTGNQPQSKSSPSQERRAVKEMLNNNNKVLIEALEKMTTTIVNKLNDKTVPHNLITPTPDKIQPASTTNKALSFNQTTPNMDHDNITDKLDTIMEQDEITTAARMQKLKDHQKNILHVSKNWSDELTKTDNNHINNTNENILRIMSNTITQLEFKVKVLEDKEKESRREINEIRDMIKNNRDTADKDKVTNPVTTDKTLANTTEFPPINAEVLKDDITNDGFVIFNNKKKMIFTHNWNLPWRWNNC